MPSEDVVRGTTVTGAAMSGALAPDLGNAPRAPLIERSGARAADALRAVEPVTLDNLEALHAAAWRATDPVVLELCRLRLAELMGDAEGLNHRTPAAVAAGLDEAKVAALSEWWRAPVFDARERAHLAFAEQFNMSVAGVSDADVDALLEHLSEKQVADFVGAVYTVEFEARVRMVAASVIGTEEG